MCYADARSVGLTFILLDTSGISITVVNQLN